MPGLPPDSLKKLASERLAECRVLLDAGKHAGAWYVCGYALEMALKAVVCKTLQLSEYPETGLGGKLKTHVVEELVLVAGLKTELLSRRTDSNFDSRWKTVTDWKVDDRYSLVRTQQDVLDLLDAYEHSTYGVLTWLTNRW